MKKFFDVIFYLFVIFFIIHVIRSNYIENISEYIHYLENNKKENEFLHTKIKHLNIENNKLNERLNNIEFYIYNKNKENLNEND